MLIILFILAAVGLRFLPHLFNFTPVLAMMLFAGAYLKPRQLWIPVAALIASDFALNIWVYHAAGGLDQYFTWGAYLFILALGWGLRGRVRPLVVGGATLFGSTLFFAISNFGVWASGLLYPRTWAGLGTCYFMGLPFFRNAVVGDLLYAAVFFGLYALAQHRALAPARSV